MPTIVCHYVLRSRASAGRRLGWRRRRRLESTGCRCLCVYTGEGAWCQRRCVELAHRNVRAANRAACCELYALPVRPRAPAGTVAEAACLRFGFSTTHCCFTGSYSSPMRSPDTVVAAIERWECEDTRWGREDTLDGAHPLPKRAINTTARCAQTPESKLPA